MPKVNLPDDFKEFIASLHANNVEYVLVGGYAVAYHGAPRFTGDIDFYVRRSARNARAIISALVDFGFSSASFTEQDFRMPDRVVQFGVPPLRVDVLTSIDGVSWDEADRSSETVDLGDVTVRVIGREELIRNKRSTGRAKDLADAEALSGSV